MASTCPVDLDTLRLRAEIESIYRRVATQPSGDFHFHRGPTYAAEMLGYDAVALAGLNRRRSAGGRACRPSRASWLQRCRRKGALRLFSRDLEGRRGQEIRGRRRKCLRPQAALTLTL